MEWTMDGGVLNQITFGIKNVHEAALPFIQGGERHPNLAIYGLNSVRGEIFRDSRVVKGLHQIKGAIEHVNSAVRATIGGIQESACLVGRDGQARVDRTRARSINRKSGMTEARRTANRGIPTADRTVECREDKNRWCRHIVFRDHKNGCVGVSDDTSRRAKGPCGAGRRRRYSYEQWNLYASSVVEGGESGTIVANPPGAGGVCNETPGVDKTWVRIRRYSRL